MMRPDDDGLPDVQGGPLLDVRAELGVRLESLTAAVAEQNDRAQRLLQAIHQVPLATKQIASNGTIDSPQDLGPSGGFWWDVRRVTAAGFSAGTVTVYKNAVVDGNQVLAFASAGVINMGKAHLLLGPKDRLVYVTANITLNSGAAGVSIGGDALQIESWALPSYLM